MTNDTLSEQMMHKESEFGAHNYHPLPVVFSRASGVNVWDPEGKHYYDFLSAYSAVNQGHCHPRLVKAMCEQACKLTLSSRAFYNDQFGAYAEYITKLFGYDMVLPMNTGAEGVETAMKIARAWAHEVKKVPEDRGIIISCSENFHGRTIGIIGMSTDPDCKKGFGPFAKDIEGYTVEYDNVDSLRELLEREGPNVAAFLVEPIQGEAGIKVPRDGYLRACYDLCKKHNVLFIADEIQTGLARTGKMLAIDHEGVHADILILGKALSGGMLPVSAVLASKEIMLCVKPGCHGSTYGGNPLACVVAVEALKILVEEKMAERAQVLGEKFRRAIQDANIPCVRDVRGKGMLNAIEVDNAKLDPTGVKRAWHICLLFAKNGLLAKPTHDNIIRLAPPLCITEEELTECVQIIKRSFEEIQTTRVEDIPGYGK